MQETEFTEQNKTSDYLSLVFSSINKYLLILRDRKNDEIVFTIKVAPAIWTIIFASNSGLATTIIPAIKINIVNDSKNHHDFVLFFLNDKIFLRLIRELNINIIPSNILIKLIIQSGLINIEILIAIDAMLIII